MNSQMSRAEILELFAQLQKRLGDAPPDAPQPALVKKGYSPKEAATTIGVSIATITRGIKDGSIPSKKYKGRRIISAETIEKLVAPATEDAA